MPNWPWHRKQPHWQYLSKVDERTFEAVVEYATASDLLEGGRILEEKSNLLLTDEAVAALQFMIADGEKNRQMPHNMGHLKDALRLLEKARMMPTVQAALDSEKQLYADMLKVVVEYMGAGKIWDLRPQIEENEEILLDEWALRTIRRIIRNGSDEPEVELWKARLRLLEETRAHNIDYAWKRYEKLAAPIVAGLVQDKLKALLSEYEIDEDDE